MKLFIGIKASKELQEKIVAWRETLQDLPVRWVSPEDLHLTLIPPWTEKNIEGVKHTLEAAVAEIQPFEIEFSHILYGPNPRKPRLIWLEGPSSRELSNIEEKLLQMLNQRNNRPLKPHITVARFRQAEFKKFPIQELDEPFHWKEKVEAVTLFESRKLPIDGVKYKTLHRVPLGSTNNPQPTTNNAM